MSRYSREQKTLLEKERALMDDNERAQRAMCRRFGVEYFASSGGLKVGIARNVRDGLLPLNGLRHAPSDDTTGWFIWAGGEPSDAPDFFVPLHVAHLVDWCPAAIPFLGLPPGWRFQVANEHQDAWEDRSLLEL